MNPPVKATAGARESGSREKPACKTARGPCKAITQTRNETFAPFGVVLAGAPLLRIGGVAELLGYGKDFVRSMIEEGKLEAHRPPDRRRGHARVTRRSVVLFMARAATYPGEELLAAVLFVVGTLIEGQRAILRDRIEKGGRR